MSQPPLLITLGDPAGIGPEIVAKALAGDLGVDDVVVVGQPEALARACDCVGHALPLRPIDRLDGRRAGRSGGAVDVLVAGADLPLPAVGEVSAAGGAAAHAAIVRAATACLDGTASGVVTAPINKASLHAAGVAQPGHTELLADLAGVEHVAMMLANQRLRVVLASIHVSLRDAIAMVTVDGQLRTIRLAAEGARGLGARSPRVAVAGLNPHAGEDRMFGDEDADVIAPAIARARADGIDASGPWPPDTVFMRARAGEFDVVVCQYHDQGLIPVKYEGLDEGVNITLGLPFWRTSVDHGTAFDIAGSGTASERSLLTAVDYARRLTAAPQRVRT